MAYFLNSFGAEFMRGNYNVDILDLLNMRRLFEWKGCYSGCHHTCHVLSFTSIKMLVCCLIIISHFFFRNHEFKSTPVRDITIYCPKFLYKLCFVTAFDDVKYLQMCRTFPNTLPMFFLHKRCHSWWVSLSGLAPLKHLCLHLNVPRSIYLVMLSKQLN